MLRRLAAIPLTLFFLSFPDAGAARLIDDWEDEQSVINSTPSRFHNSWISGPFLTSERRLRVFSNPGVELNTIIADVGGGQYRFQQLTDGRGNTDLAYTTLNDIDFTGGGTRDAFLVRVAEIDGVFDITIRILSGSADGGLSMEVSEPGDVLFPFAAFTPSGPHGPADPASVRHLDLRVNLDFDTTGPGSIVLEAPFLSVPEPAVVWLLGSALLVLAGVANANVSRCKL